MKRFLSLVLTLAMICSLAACGGKKEEAPADSAPTTSAPAESASKGKIVFSDAFYRVSYCAVMHEGAMKAAEELGYELEILNGEQDQAKALEQVKLASEKGAAGIIVLPADVAGSGAVIDYLKSQDTPWMFCNNYSEADVKKDELPLYVGADMNTHSVNMIEMIKQYLPDGGKILAVQGTAGHAQTVSFDEYYATLDPNKYIFLDKQDGNFDENTSLEKASDMITKYGKEADLIIAEGPPMMTGTIAALKSAGYKPGDFVMLTAGSSTLIKDAMVEGWCSATSTQEPYLEGYTTVQYMVKAIEGQDIPETYIPIDEKICTKDDIDKYTWW